jgi:F-type H+-transporting ATPase subunit epsilon
MLRLTLQTPFKKLVVESEIQEISVPAIKGTVQVLPGHADYVSALETGVLRWRSGETWHTAAISWGFVEIRDELVTVLGDNAELSQDIDLGRAQAAESKARRSLESGVLDDDFRRQELKLARALARQAAIG